MNITQLAIDTMVSQFRKRDLWLRLYGTDNKELSGIGYAPKKWKAKDDFVLFVFSGGEFDVAGYEITDKKGATYMRDDFAEVIQIRRKDDEIKIWPQITLTPASSNKSLEKKIEKP